jgi:alkylhydroperoxidase/carboxymuconolactone decarboxylase family protein YurZ/quinol monooxygenase YgiN
MAYICSVTWTAKSGSEETVLEALVELASESRSEPGNLYFQPYRDPDEPRILRIFEVYQDVHAFEAHKASGHFKRLVEGRIIPELEPPVAEGDFYQDLTKSSRGSMEADSESARERGQRAYYKLFGHKRSMRGAGRLAALTIDHLFADVWSRSELSTRDRSMITVALLAAQGRDNELRTHLKGARRQGISEVEIEEIMIHVAHYAGWAAGHHGLAVAKEKAKEK